MHLPQSLSSFNHVLLFAIQNEPTFYTEDGTPFTAADPEYAEKYQELMEKQDYFHDADGENGNEEYDIDDEMDPEIEEAYENFCLESEMKRKQ
ncbi:Polyadenylate-binding protein-interacting protein 1 [Ilyodon furcidens]|uniref:Polyadenylate-binding protein-interacting protein 1 n=3 Tax=Goodeidae TaxID=28758 RepID=A0ABU7BWP9_9TELE|nr:Polyadenylate-binding protein-interacting protein 1 [Ataeniobius toweri]